MKTRLCILLSLILAVSCAARAGESGAMSVRLMSWAGDLPDIWLRDGGDYVPARAGEFILGRPLMLRARTGEIRVFRDVELDGATRKQPLASVPMPAGANDVLVLLAPSAEGGELPLEGKAFDQSLEAHPLDTLRVLNLSSHTLGLKVGDDTVSVASGAERLFSFQAAGQANLAVYLAVAEGEAGWKLVQSSLLATPRGRRVLGIVRDGRPDMAIEDPVLRIKPVDAIFLVDRAAPAPAQEADSLAQR